MGGGANHERCILIPQQTKIKLEATGTRRTDIPMVVGVQKMGDRPVAACTRYSGDDLDIEAIHPSQQKMTKRQQTGNKPVAAGSRHMDFDPRVETDLYLK